MTDYPIKSKIFKLLDANGKIFESPIPGKLGGNSKMKIYGQLDCYSANSALKNGYDKIRVFFADEATAIAAGYRPCGNCMRERYHQWKEGPKTGQDYPWLVTPPSRTQ
jgi:hypothetical protein